MILRKSGRHNCINPGRLQHKVAGAGNLTSSLQLMIQSLNLMHVSVSIQQELIFLIYAKIIPQSETEINK